MADGSLPTPEKRKPLTRRQFAELLIQQACRCGCGCGKALKADRIVDEHLVPLHSLGANDLSNRSLWDRDCSKAKTVREAPALAKGRRIRGEVGNGPKRPIRSRGFQKGASAKIRSRGFPSKFERERLKAIREKTPIEEAADA